MTERKPSGFVVRADPAIAALKSIREEELSGKFAWRIVAKRKDIEGARLEHVTVPPEPALPSMAHPPTAVEPR